MIPLQNRLKQVSKMKRFLLIFTIVCCSSIVFSQSLLWEITSKNNKVSYLYGTIHIQDKKVFAFDSTVINALNSCEAFAAELLLDEITTEVSQAIFMKNNTIKNLTTNEQYRIIDSTCKASAGHGIMLLNTMKPFFVLSYLQQTSMPKDVETALDVYLLQLARKNNQTCYGLETFADQIKAIDNISLENQIDMLMESIKDTSNSYETLLDAYLNFDLNKLLDLLQDSNGASLSLDDMLVNNRNTTMAKQFAKIAKKQTLFCAVGAGHLPGDKGIIALLRKKGFTAKAIPFTWIEK